MVDMKTIGNLFLTVVGANVPSADQAGSPWFKTTSDGAPDGIFILDNGKYVSALPAGVTVQGISDPLIQFGTITLDVNDVGKTLRGVVHTFETEYVTPPHIQTSLISDTELPFDSEFRLFATADEKQISVDFHSGAEPRVVVFNWMTIGQVAPTIG